MKANQFSTLSIFTFFLAILVLGFSAQLLGEDKEEWKRLETSDPPPPRYCHSQIFDAKRHTITIFGGWIFDSEKRVYTMLNDTWQLCLADTTWSEIETEIKPSPRGSYAILDSLNDRLLLFGGFALSDYNFYVYNDLWEFRLDSLKWKELFPSGDSPTNIGVTPLVHDKIRNRIIFFGGEAHTPPYEALDVTWSLELDSLQWNKLETNDMKPMARWGHSAIYDISKDRMIIFGGKYEDQNFMPWYLNDVWALNFQTNEWQELVPDVTRPPSARAAMAMIHDYTNDRLLMFGGEGNNILGGQGSLNDIWEFNLSTSKWRELAPNGETPTERSFITANHNSSANKMYVFGGNNSFGQMLNDTYELSIPKIQTQISKRPNLISHYKLYQNYPNPFNPCTTIEFKVPVQSYVRLDIFDRTGRHIKTLLDKNLAAGQYKELWNADNATGQDVPAGVYFVRLKAGDVQRHIKLTLIK